MKFDIGINFGNIINHKPAQIITLQTCSKPQLKNCSKIKKYFSLQKHETVNEKSLLK